VSKKRKEIIEYVTGGKLPAVPGIPVRVEQFPSARARQPKVIVERLKERAPPGVRRRRARRNRKLRMEAKLGKQYLSGTGGGVGTGSGGSGTGNGNGGSGGSGSQGQGTVIGGGTTGGVGGSGGPPPGGSVTPPATSVAPSSATVPYPSGYDPSSGAFTGSSGLVCWGANTFQAAAAQGGVSCSMSTGVISVNGVQAAQSYWAPAKIVATCSWQNTVAWTT